MSNQPPYGQGSWQQPPAGPPPGQGPGGPPGPPPGPPGPGGPPPPGGGSPPPGGPGGPPPPGGPGGPPPPGGPGGPPGGPPPPGGPGGPGGPPEFGPGPGGPPGKSKTPLILGIVGAVVVLVGAGLLLYFLVFSGDDDEAGDYCTLLEDNKDLFSELSGDAVTDPARIEEVVGIVHDLREAAPEEVADEWASIDDPFQNLQQALDDADISWEEADQMQPEEFPEEVSDAANEMFDTFSQLDMSAIGQTIEDHAVDECGIDPEEFESGGQ